MYKDCAVLCLLQRVIAVGAYGDDNAEQKSTTSVIPILTENEPASTRSPFVALLSRRAQSGR